jgi:hypothetical protein
MIIYADRWTAAAFVVVPGGEYKSPTSILTVDEVFSLTEAGIPAIARK